MEMRDQPAQHPAVDRPHIEVAEQDHRHRRAIRTLQHLLDLCASFSRCQSLMHRSCNQVHCDSEARKRPNGARGITVEHGMDIVKGLIRLLDRHPIF